MFIIYGLLSDLWQSLGVVLDVQFFCGTAPHLDPT